MQWQSPAKINLHLRVGGVRPDGFHPLMSWMVTVGLFDKLSFEFDQNDPASEPKIKLSCDDSYVPTDDSNLIARAFRVWIDYLSQFGSVREQLRILFEHKGVLHVSLEKRIPSGGGLGGGSSNAATTLIALEILIMIRELIGTTPIKDRRMRWCVESGIADKEMKSPMVKKKAEILGSDVPFFFDAPSALSSGRGEKIVRVASPKPLAAMLFLPPFGVSTAEAYRVLDQLRPHAPEDALDPIDVEEWKMLSAAALLPRLRNDLEAAAFHLQPQLGELREMLERKLERPVRMSGSGSTLFTLYDTEPEAHEALRKNLGSEFGLAKVLICSVGSARIEQII